MRRGRYLFMPLVPWDTRDACSRHAGERRNGDREAVGKRSFV